MQRSILEDKKQIDRPPQIPKLKTKGLKWTGCKLQHWHSNHRLNYDIFVSNMKNTVVQERLFIQPNDNPEEVLNFAVALE